MDEGKASVRWYVERIAGVSATWFEWEFEDDNLVKTLVVEVGFDTDPNSTKFRQEVMNAIVSTAQDVLNNETTMVVSHLRIVPQRRS